MVILVCEKFVIKVEVMEVMVCLLKRYLMLRMIIKEIDKEYFEFKFVEMNFVKFDI